MQHFLIQVLNGVQLSMLVFLLAVGLTLIGWIFVEMVVLAGVGSIAWALYLVLGTSIASVGVVWWRSSRTSNGSH